MFTDIIFVVRLAWTYFAVFDIRILAHVTFRIRGWKKPRFLKKKFLGFCKVF